MRLPTPWQKRKDAEQDSRELAVRQQREANREEREREANFNYQKIVAALERIDHRAEHQAKENPAKEKRAETWERRKFWLEIAGVTIAVGAAWILYWTLDETKRATIEANRAWLAPTGIWHNKSAAYALGEPITYNILFRNIGKNPALRLRWRIENGVMPLKNRNLNIAETDFSQVDMCGSIEPSSESQTVWPDTTQPVYTTTAEGFPLPALTLQSDQLSQGPKVKITKALLEGDEVFYVQGCIAYSTMTIVGKSSFCFFVNLARGPSGNAGGAISIECRNGNSAN